MSGEMIPAGGAPGQIVPAFGKANASGAVIAPMPDVMGGGSFGETWKIDKDKHVFVNRKTNEMRTELYIAVTKAHPNRVLFVKGQEGRVCYSDDASSSYQGIACASCPRVSEVKVFNGYYEKHPDQQRPGYVGDCSLRYSLSWKQDFVVTPQGLVCFEHEDVSFFSAPKSSVYAMFGNNAYMPKLEQMGLDITKVVTKIVLKQRMNEQLKTMYDYADFEFAGTLQEVLGKCVNVVKVASGQSAQPGAVGAAPASFPGQFPPGAPAALPHAGLPTMAGAAPAPTQAAGFPQPSNPPGFPQAAQPQGFPGPAAQPAGFPAPAAQPQGFPAPAAQPQGFPAPAGAPAAQPPAQAQAPAAAPQPSFAQMQRDALARDFAVLPDAIKPAVLNVLQVKDVKDIPDDRLIQAQQAVQSAKSFQTQQPAAAGAPAYPF